MRWNPHVTVSTVIEDNNRFLMVEEQVDSQIVWNQPAGHLEADESLIEAACRETLEETGHTVRIDSLLGIYQAKSGAQNDTYLRVCFIGTALGYDENLPLDTGIIRACWLTRDEIEEKRTLMRSPTVIGVIDDYLAEIRYPLSLIHTRLS
ncbi:MAG: NUDIX hydrolase [Pseudomonadales bacterium]|nr:NUDIX hydrolase [Pseudomonadales bacterium]